MQDAPGDHLEIVGGNNVFDEHCKLVAAKTRAESCGRSEERRRPAIAISKTSPAAWPRLSFTPLKLSRSR